MNIQDPLRTQRRRAKEWQLDVLKKLPGNPTEEQRLAAAAETGLDEKWIKNWFTRQRSKAAARNRNRQPATTDPPQPRPHPPTVPTFKLQLHRPPAASQGHLPGRSVSTSINPAPCPSTNSRQSSSASCESRCPARSTANTQAIPRSHRSVSAPTYLNDPSQKPTLAPHTAAIPTYSRDPLCNRYPDFSQFFHPQVHERFGSFALLAPLNDHDHLIRLLANPNIVLRDPLHFQGLFHLLNPIHFGGSSTPVAFSMRLGDLLGHPWRTRYPVLRSELGHRI